MKMLEQKLEEIVSIYREDAESVYNTWFINNEARLKAFRSIRRGVLQVVEDIKQDIFPNDFKGSSLEFVISAIAEQKQVFEGAAHPFYWKPKLRIPDIYESQENKKYFGQFLENCLNAKNEKQLIKEIIRLDSRKIKGLGPAVANILYFLHPTIIPPFNTAIVRGFNLLFGEKIKLGSWKDYLKMRSVLIDVIAQNKNLFSKDLGDISGLLFDIGVAKIIIDENASLAEEKYAKKRDSILQKRHKQVQEELEEENTHTKIQYYLLKMGRSLGYDVIVAKNDKTRSYNGESFSFLSLPRFPKLEIDPEVGKTISLIDVLWFREGTNDIVCAFEVEKSTTIYSGMLRLLDLAASWPQSDPAKLYLVVPKKREKEVIAQLKRPSMKTSQEKISYILFDDLCDHFHSICKLGDDHTILAKIAKCPC